MTSSLARQRCSHCAHPVEPNAKFCGECGTTSTGVHHQPYQSGIHPQMPGYHPLNPASHPIHPEMANALKAMQYDQQSISQQFHQPVVVPNTVSYDDLAQLEAFRLSQVNGTQMEWKPTPTGTVPLPPSGGAPTFAVTTPDRKVSPQLVREMQTLNASILRERLFLLFHCSIFLICNLVGFYLALKCYYGYNGDEMTRIVIALTPLTFVNAIALACLAPIKGTRREILRLLEKRQYVQFQLEYSHLL